LSQQKKNTICGHSTQKIMANTATVTVNGIFANDTFSDCWCTCLGSLGITGKEMMAYTATVSDSLFGFGTLLLL
jgi:hypothetical protein